MLKLVVTTLSLLKPWVHIVETTSKLFARLTTRLIVQVAFDGKHRGIHFGHPQIHLWHKSFSHIGLSVTLISVFTIEMTIVLMASSVVWCDPFPLSVVAFPAPVELTSILDLWANRNSVFVFLKHTSSWAYSHPRFELPTSCSILLGRLSPLLPITILLLLVSVSFGFLTTIIQESRLELGEIGSIVLGRNLGVKKITSRWPANVSWNCHLSMKSLRHN